jgi:dihydropteroate synthase
VSKIWGILNVTPDSFSDGGSFLQTDLALKQANCLIDSGANVIDIGAESTRPGASKISWTEEWRRIRYVLEPLRELTKSRGVQVSLDSYKHQVIDRALPYIDIINDVTALKSKKVINIVKESGLPAVIMHNLTVPADPDVTIPENVDSMDHIMKWFQKKIVQLEGLGVKKTQLILDPGIGFGKTPYQSLYILDNISKMQQFNLPILVGHSRKGFLKLFSAENLEEKDFNTAIISTYLSAQKITHIRVHNVKITKKLIELQGLIFQSP